MKITATIVTTLGVIALFAAFAAFAAAQRPAPSAAVKASSGAKDLFYDTSAASPTVAAPSGSGYMGVSYWVELMDASGRLARVTADHVFRAGDRIRLNVQPNRDGYLTVLNIGSTGRVTTLFPSPAEGSSGAPVRASQVYQVPATGFLRFDANPGEETLMLLLSPTPTGSTATTGAPMLQGGAASAQTSPPPSASPGSTVPPSAPPPPVHPGSAMAPVAPPASVSPDDTARLVREAMARGAKDLVVENDARHPQPASYAVAPVASLQQGGMITLPIKLRHQ